MRAILGAHLAWAVLVVLFTIALHPPAGAMATETKPVSTIIIVVDTNRIQRDSLAGKAIVEQREKYQQAFSAEFDAQRRQLQKDEMELAKQKNLLSQQAFEQRTRAFTEEVASFQRRYQAAIKALENSAAKAHNELQRITIETTSELASEVGAGLVLHKQTVFLHDERMDVTDRVIERINSRTPTVAFPPPNADEALPQIKPARK